VHASDDLVGNTLPEEVDSPRRYYEGATKQVSVNSYERNAEARSKCLERHGFKCAVCSFDFHETYGDIGRRYIHVHHVVPLSEVCEDYELDPVSDLIPVCPNCHAMIHRTKSVLTIDQLKTHLRERKRST
jgi:5-methylcytosine-specific restriction protein A